jgi:hypothetical protein
MPYPNCNRLDDAQLAFQHHQSRQINELTANVRQLMVLVQARAEMSPVPGQSYEYGAGASFIPEFGVASGRDFIFRPRYGDGLPLQHCVPWSAKENGACNGTTTGGLSNANGGRYEPPRMNTLFAGPRNSQKGNSGGFNGFSLFRSHKKHCSINKEEVSLDEYIRCMSTPEGAARNKKSVNVVGELAQQLKNKGQKGANAFFANQWKDLPDEEKAIYKRHASYIKNVKRAVDKKCQIVSKI